MFALRFNFQKKIEGEKFFVQFWFPLNFQPHAREIYDIQLDLFCSKSKQSIDQLVLKWCVVGPSCHNVLQSVELWGWCQFWCPKHFFSGDFSLSIKWWLYFAFACLLTCYWEIIMCLEDSDCVELYRKFE